MLRRWSTNTSSRFHGSHGPNVGVPGRSLGGVRYMSLEPDPLDQVEIPSSRRRATRLGERNSRSRSLFEVIQLFRRDPLGESAPRYADRDASDAQPNAVDPTTLPLSPGWSTSTRLHAAGLVHVPEISDSM